MKKHPGRFNVAVLLFLFISAIPVFSQIDIRLPSEPAFFQNDFYKQSTTWNWLGRLNLFDTSSVAWNWRVDDTFQSNLLTPAQGSRQWKDEHSFYGYFYRNFNGVRGGIYSKSWLQSDRQTATHNQYSNHTLGFFSGWNFKKTISLQPYLGYQQARNRQKIDWGWDAGLRTNVFNWRVGDYLTALDAESHYDLYDKRQNYENKFYSTVRADFTSFTSDSFSFSFSEVSKQYWVSDSIEQVKIFNRDFRNKLFYQISQRDLFTLMTQVQSRDISYFNGRNIFYIDNQLRYLHLGQRLQYSLALRTNDETQDNAGIYTDSRNRQTAFNLKFNYLFNAQRWLQLEMAYVKLQYDTPDSIVNNDDRDEQRYVFNLNYFQKFSPVFSMSWEAYAYFFHQIYIFKEQSMNNSWNRVYKLNPRVNYEYGRLSNTLSTQVLANYTVYDFEDTLAQTRSFVFRKYTFSDSLILRLFAENYAGIFTRLELEDKGSFFEKEYAQQVLQSYRSQFYNFFVFNDYFFYFHVKVGYTVYNRREWRHIPLKKLSREITNQGPYLTLSYRRSQRLTFSAYAALSTLTDSKAGRAHYATGYLRLYYNL